MTQIERKQAERILESKTLTNIELIFLKRLCWQNSVFVMAQDLCMKPHDLNKYIKGEKKLHNDQVLTDNILQRLFLKLTQRPKIVVDQN